MSRFRWHSGWTPAVWEFALTALIVGTSAFLFVSMEY